MALVEQWHPLATYLESQLGRNVELTAYSFPELTAAIEQNRVDIILANPGHYIMLRQQNKLSAPLASLINQENEFEIATFGGVIFTRADSSNINSLTDLVDKRIATVSTDSFGGYQTQVFELLQASVALPNKETLLITGMPQDQVVDAVLAGHADVGFVRTGLLESMVREGKLDLRQVKIINKKNSPAFPLISSSALYPEWPVAVTPQLDKYWSRQLTIALLSLSSDSNVARAIKIHGFTIPADYSGVENVLRQLRMPPFDSAPTFTLVDLWNKYAEWITSLGILGLLLVVTTTALMLQYRRVKRAMRYNRSLIEACLDPLVTISKEGKIMDVNSATIRVTGVPREQLRGSDFSDFFTDPESAKAGYQKVFSDGIVNDYPLAIRHREGNVIDVLYNASLYKNENGQVEGVFAAARDISERKRFEDELRESEDRLSLAARHNGVGIWDWNLETQTLVWDDSMFTLYHIRREDFSGVVEAWEKLLHPDDQERAEQEVQTALEGGKPFDTEFRVFWPTGEIHYIKAAAKVFRDGKGKPLRMLGTNIDITERKQLQLELERQAHTDFLTGVYSRRYFMEQSELEMNRVIRYGKPLSIFMMDIDFFKLVNDNYGHKVGDTVLKTLGNVCRETLREVDIIGRVGGEEFAILLPETEQSEAMDVAERLRKAIADTDVPMENNPPLHITVSIGIATTTSKDNNMDILLHLADQALYQSKEAGRNKVIVATQ